MPQRCYSGPCRRLRGLATADGTIGHPEGQILIAPILRVCKWLAGYGEPMWRSRDEFDPELGKTALQKGDKRRAPASSCAIDRSAHDGAKRGGPRQNRHAFDAGDGVLNRSCNGSAIRQREAPRLCGSTARKRRTTFAAAYARGPVQGVSGEKLEEDRRLKSWLQVRLRHVSPQPPEHLPLLRLVLGRLKAWLDSAPFSAVSRAPAARGLGEASPS